MIPIEFPIEELKARATAKKKAFKKALQKTGSGSVADKKISAIHSEVFDCTDCLACANCCKTTGPLFTNKDIDRLSSYLKMKPGAFVDQYLRIDEDNDYVLKSVPCPFLMDDNACSVYESRPRACREYPHTDQSGQAGMAALTLKNATICPAVYAILEKLETIK